jgi:hypothetical protein
MRLYFTTGAGGSLFGPYQYLAVVAARSIEATFDLAVTDTAGSEKMKRVSQQAEQWAEDHPILGPYYDRPSAIPFLREFQVEAETGFGGTLGDISQDVRSISGRINLLAAQVPREARWQAEYMVSEAEIGSRFDSLSRDLGATMRTLRSLAAAAESGEIAIDVRSLQTLHSDIVRLMEQIGVEREIVLADVASQRTETLARIDALADRVLAQASFSATDLIDHFIWRVALLLALFAAGGVIVVLILRRSRHQSS